jgi:putative intracellular protease/amidase
LWEGKVVVDLEGGLITGQNPASAGAVGEAILGKVLKGRVENQ